LRKTLVIYLVCEPETGASFAASYAAGSVVVTIPILIMVLIFQRRIVSGLTAGAVKG